jgi:hypothetical protein
MRRNVELEISSPNLIKGAAITPLHGRDSNAKTNTARSEMPVRLGLSVHNAAAIRMEHLTGYIGRIVRSEKTNQWRLLPARPAWPSGGSEPNVATSLAGKVEGISGVQIGPGATAFPRIFFSFGIQKRFSLLVNASALPTCGRGQYQGKNRENPVDGGLTRINFFIPLKRGNSPNQEFVLRTFGTANWTQFCPGNDTRKAVDRGSGRHD